MRYNCSILDLHARSVIASITDRNSTSDLAIRTLQKALNSQPEIAGELILHRDQGSQFTSKSFVEFCGSVHVTQSMSKAGCPYDDAPMERYFNTLKNECTNLYKYDKKEALYQAVEEFAYVEYKIMRVHIAIPIMLLRMKHEFIRNNSGRGTQCTSELYHTTLRKYDIIQSMNSAGGRCHDDARCESMWAR